MSGSQLNIASRSALAHHGGCWRWPGEGHRRGEWGRAASHAGTAPNVWRSRRPGPGRARLDSVGYNVASAAGDPVFGVVPLGIFTCGLLNVGSSDGVVFNPVRTSRDRGTKAEASRARNSASNRMDSLFLHENARLGRDGGLAWAKG